MSGSRFNASHVSGSPRHPHSPLNPPKVCIVVCPAAPQPAFNGWISSPSVCVSVSLFAALAPN